MICFYFLTSRINKYQLQNDFRTITYVRTINSRMLKSRNSIRFDSIRFVHDEEQKNVKLLFIRIRDTPGAFKKQVKNSEASWNTDTELKEPFVAIIACSDQKYNRFEQDECCLEHKYIIQ